MIFSLLWDLGHAIMRHRPKCQGSYRSALSVETSDSILPPYVINDSIYTSDMPKYNTAYIFI